MAKKATVKSKEFYIDKDALIGKATVKHFLNTKLKAVEDPFTKEKKYPIYMRVVFARKSTYIKSNFLFFSDYDDGANMGIIDNLLTNPLAESGLVASEKKFNSKEYEEVFKKEAKVVSEIFQFYGRYGINIIDENTIGFIKISLLPINKVYSDFVWRKLRSELPKNDFHFLLNENIRFSKQFEVIQRYGNHEAIDYIKKYQTEYDYSVLLSRSKNVRIYEWIENDVKSHITAMFAEYPKFLLSVKQSLLEYFKLHLYPEHHKLFEKIKKDI